jgi:hypothetical protein
LTQKIFNRKIEKVEEGKKKMRILSRIKWSRSLNYLVWFVPWLIFEFGIATTGGMK